MKIGCIGLGKMGENMVARLLEKGHRVTVFDVDENAVKTAEQAGAQAAGSVADLLSKLGEKERAIWIMVPHKVVDNVLEDLRPHLKQGDVVIDGGNSFYKDSLRRAKALNGDGVDFMDVGVSGGPKGARTGACLMIGAKKKLFNRYEKLWRDLSVKDGFGHMGPPGSGHFVKMVHNGIEYGMMQAVAEGFSLMRNSKFKLDLSEVARVYNRGSVIESRLIGWMHEAFKEFGDDLNPVSKTAIGTGEGKWTAEFAKEISEPAKVIYEAWRARKRSEKIPNYQAQIIMALRNQFGGHDIDVDNE